MIKICDFLSPSIRLGFPSQSVEKLFPIISYDYLSQPTPSLGQREPAFSPRNHAQYCPSTADWVVICVFKQGYTLGKISSLFKKDLEMNTPFPNARSEKRKIPAQNDRASTNPMQESKHIYCSFISNQHKLNLPRATDAKPQFASKVSSLEVSNSPRPPHP